MGAGCGRPWGQDPHQEHSFLRRDDLFGSQKSHQTAHLQRPFYITDLLRVCSNGARTQSLTCDLCSPCHFAGLPRPLLVRQFLLKLPRLALNSLYSSWESAVLVPRTDRFHQTRHKDGFCEQIGACSLFLLALATAEGLSHPGLHWPVGRVQVWWEETQASCFYWEKTVFRRSLCCCPLRGACTFLLLT